VICIELPKPAIQNVKMFVREVLTDDIDVILITDLKKGFQQI